MMRRRRSPALELALRLVPPSYRDTVAGDLIEIFSARRRSAGPLRSGLTVLAEIVRSAPSMLMWRLSRGLTRMNERVVATDPFALSRLTPGATAGRAIGLFRSTYLRVLAVFLLVHFPLRIVGHFVRTSESITEALGHVAYQALAANGLLLVSWVVVEGAILVTLIRLRRGERIGVGVSLLESLRRFPAFFTARLLFWLLVLPASAALLVPGVIVAALLMLHGWLIFDRGLGPVESLTESARLVKSRLRQTVGLSLPVCGMTFVWVALGVVFVAMTLRATAPIMPIFKIAPLTMTLMETGFLLIVILTGIVYSNYVATPRAERT